MGFPKVVMTEERRRRIALFLGFLYVVCCTASAILVGHGIFVHSQVQNKIAFLTAYDGGALPFTMISVGIFSFLATAIGTKIVIDFNKPVTRAKIRHFYLPLLAYYFVVFIVTFFTLIFAMFELIKVATTMEEGLAYVMRSYQTNGELKKEMDLLQIEYECCGEIGFSDWFEIEWIHHDYRTDEHIPKSSQTKLAMLTDSVPFSCCNPLSPRPCIHNHVTDDTRHYAYDHNLSPTLFQAGCKNVLRNYFEKDLLTQVGLLIAGLAILQSIALIFSRLLQTSVDSLVEMGKSSQTTNIGWLIGRDDNIDLEKKDTPHDELVDHGEEFPPYEYEGGYGEELEGGNLHMANDGLSENDNHNAKYSKSAPEPLTTTSSRPPTSASNMTTPATTAEELERLLAGVKPDNYQQDDIPLNLDSDAYKPVMEPKNVSFSVINPVVEESQSEASAYNPYENMVFPTPQENTSSNSNNIPAFLRLMGGR